MIVQFPSPSVVCLDIHGHIDHFQLFTVLCLRQYGFLKRDYFSNLKLNCVFLQYYIHV